jgi:DNA (cytosine-5)-methyltransferase 1
MGRQDYETETMIVHTLRGEGFDASEDGTGRGAPLVPVSVALRGREGGAALEMGDDQAFTLRASTGGGDKPHVLAFDCKSSGQNGFGIGEIAGTQRAMGHANSHTNGGGHQAVMAGMAVRRLTPRECERLQGFPDDYTLVPHRGKPAADGPRYKALGNSMAVPVMAWIGQRIQAVDDILQRNKEAA